MSKMTLTSLDGSWVPDHGLSHEALTAALASIINEMHEQAAQQGLTVDWSTFSCQPDVDEMEFASLQGDRHSYRSTTFRYGVVAAKVEDD